MTDATYTSHTTDTTDDLCLICLDSESDQTLLHPCKCSARVHTDCMLRYADTVSTELLCPACRLPLPSHPVGTVHRLRLSAIMCSLLLTAILQCILVALTPVPIIFGLFSIGAYVLGHVLYACESGTPWWISVEHRPISSVCCSRENVLVVSEARCEEPRAEHMLEHEDLAAHLSGTHT